MAEASFGIKQTCTACNARFYDLNKSPIICPICEVVYVAPVKAVRRPRRAPRSGFNEKNYAHLYPKSDAPEKSEE